MKRILLLLMCFLLLPCLALADLTVYYIDVGQGDSALIVCDGDAMIIDGGIPGDKVYSFIKNHGITKLEYMISTHPDEDHVGGLAGVLNAVPVETIFSPVKEWDTKAFKDFKNYADKQGAPISIPYVGDEYYLGDATFTILSCDYSAKIPNEMSICLRIDYGETSFLFTGDVEGYALHQLLSLNAPLEATVLKVSHHGSDKSNPEELLRIVKPEYAIISCGKNNYGHPAQATLNMLKNQDVKLFRTDLQGTITCVSDGKTITFTPEHTAQSDLFVAPTK